MNISSISSTYSALGTNAVTTPQVSGDMPPPPDDDSGQVHRRHGGHGHGGGQMMQAVAQALQSLGLSLPDKTEAADGTGATTAVSATDATSSATSATDGTSSNTSSTAASGTGDIRQDMHDFMHALFEAVKADSSADSSSGSSSDSGQGNGDPRANFASGLAALVTQAANGNAPSELQSAFAKLQADLTVSAGTATSSSDGTAATSTASTASTNAAQATLQAFLTQLQQNLGYGSSASLAATGNVISTQV